MFNTLWQEAGNPICVSRAWFGTSLRPADPEGNVVTEYRGENTHVPGKVAGQRVGRPSDIVTAGRSLHDRSSYRAAGSKGQCPSDVQQETLL